jgi:hypothetical protein
MQYIYYQEEGDIFNASIERPQTRNYERIATRFGTDTEESEISNEQSGVEKQVAIAEQ